mgnify:CR=1
MMECGHAGAVGQHALRAVGGEKRCVGAIVLTPLPAMEAHRVMSIPKN